MNELSDVHGSAVVAEPEEMSITADAFKGQCQFNLHPLAPQPSAKALGIFLLYQLHLLNIRRWLIPEFQIPLVPHFC